MKRIGHFLLLCALLALCGPAGAQIPGGNAIVLGSTPVLNGSVNGDCLIVSGAVVGQTTCGAGTVTSVSVTTANGVAGAVATPTTTPAITFTLGPNLRLGVADAASAVAQAVSVQSVVAGTLNTAGSALTVTGSQGTGTGLGGSIIFQTAPAGTTGTAQNALATALTIDSTKGSTFAGVAFLSDGTNAAPGLAFSGETGTGLLRRTTNALDIDIGGTPKVEISATQVRLASSVTFAWSSGAINTGGDTLLSRRGPANFLLGGADAAAPVAQTLSTQGVVAGTSNIAGANFTISGSPGTGTGTGGSIILQTAAASTTGSTQNALAAALTIDSTKLATFAGIILPATSATPTCGSGCASITGNDQKFVATTGTAQTSVTINFGHTWAATPVCAIGSGSTASVVDISSISTTAVVFGASVALTATPIYVLCF